MNHNHLYSKTNCPICFYILLPGPNPDILECSNQHYSHNLFYNSIQFQFNSSKYSLFCSINHKTNHCAIYNISANHNSSSDYKIYSISTFNNIVNNSYNIEHLKTKLFNLQFSLFA